MTEKSISETLRERVAAYSFSPVIYSKGRVSRVGDGVVRVTGLPGRKYGELLDVNENDGVLVVKAKIEPSYNNKATIDQNYFNVDDLIQSQGCDKFDEIQYWAVADMTDGSEQKVISFTVDKALIDQIAGGDFPANTMGDYVTDLWIHQSLEQ